MNSYFLPQKEGIIDLDSKIVSTFVNKLLCSIIHSKESRDFRHFLKKNPSGNDLINGLEEFADYPLIDSILIWFDYIHRNHNDGLKRLKKSEISFSDLLYAHFSYFHDASYLDSLEGFDYLSKDNIKINIIVKKEQNIILRRSVLNTIASYSQEYYVFVKSYSVPYCSKGASV